MRNNSQNSANLLNENRESTDLDYSNISMIKRLCRLICNDRPVEFQSNNSEEGRGKNMIAADIVSDVEGRYNLSGQNKIDYQKLTEVEELNDLLLNSFGWQVVDLNLGHDVCGGFERPYFSVHVEKARQDAIELEANSLMAWVDVGKKSYVSGGKVRASQRKFLEDLETGVDHLVSQADLERKDDLPPLLICAKTIVSGGSEVCKHPFGVLKFDSGDRREDNSSFINCPYSELGQVDFFYARFFRLGVQGAGRFELEDVGVIDAGADAELEASIETVEGRIRDNSYAAICFASAAALLLGYFLVGGGLSIVSGFSISIADLLARFWPTGTMMIAFIAGLLCAEFARICASYATGARDEMNVFIQEFHTQNHSSR